MDYYKIVISNEKQHRPLNKLLIYNVYEDVTR